MTRDELVGQIVRLLDVRLLDPLEVLLDGDDAVDAMRRVVRIRAGRWADAMLTGDDPVAAHTAMRLVATLHPGDRPFDPPADWWATPLGQVIARRVGHPASTSVSYAVAGAMLGITRQGVHDLVRRGRLPRHPDGGVPSAAVRDRLLGLSPTDPSPPHGGAPSADSSLPLLPTGGAPSAEPFPGDSSLPLLPTDEVLPADGSKEDLP